MPSVMPESRDKGRKTERVFANVAVAGRNKKERRDSRLFAISLPMFFLCANLCNNNNSLTRFLPACLLLKKSFCLLALGTLFLLLLRLLPPFNVRAKHSLATKSS